MRRTKKGRSTMIDEDLINKINSIEDLPISEEMLGAYLEDNLSPYEVYDVESAIRECDYLNELTNGDLEYNTVLDFSIDSAIENFELPIISDNRFIELDMAFPSSFPETEELDYLTTCAVENQYPQDDSYNDDNIDNPFEEDDTSFDSSDDNDISVYE